MYKIWFFADDAHEPTHVATYDSFDAAFETVERTFGLDWYGAGYEALHSGGSTRTEHYDGCTGTLVCVRLTGL